MRYKRYKYAIVAVLVLFIAMLIKMIFFGQEKILYMDINSKECKSRCSSESINKALLKISNSKEYNTLYLRGEGECIIKESITIPSNIKLLGDELVTIKLKDNLNWEKYKPIIGQLGVDKWTPFGDKNQTVENIEIGGFKIDVGAQKRPNGRGYFPIIFLYNPSNVKIHNLTLINSKWDTIRLSSFPIRRAINSEIYSNKILNSGHEGVAIINSTDFKIYNNEILNTRTNCGIRVKSCNRFTIYKNIIGNSLEKKPSGYAGVLIENRDSTIDEANISENLIYGKNIGIVLDGADKNLTRQKSGVYIYKNIIYRPKHLLIGKRSFSGGIRINDFNNTLIEENIIEKSDFDGVIYRGKIDNNLTYQTTLKRNIIIDNRRYGVNNSPKSKNSHRFILEENILYGNRSNYLNTSSKSDIYKKPLFSKPHTIKGSWHHIALVYSNRDKSLTLYIDAKERFSKKNVDLEDVSSNGKELFIGSYRGVAHYFIGKIALKIFNRDLNSTEIQELYTKSYKKRNSYDNEIEIIDLKTTEFNRRYRDIKYPKDTHLSSNFTISAWIYSMRDDKRYHTILNKGSEGNNHHIWLYTKGDNIFIRLKDGDELIKMDTPILDFGEIFKIKSKKKGDRK